MTRYGFDEQRGAIVRSWPTGDGDLVADVATVPAGCAPQQSFGVSDALTTLSRFLWRAYTHPTSAADSLEANTDGWRRQNARDAFAKVPENILKPNLPFEDGGLIVSYNRVEEASHRLGRALHVVGDEAFTAAVVEEARQELSAVEQAELGDLSGRARQAVA
ncbi:hypothetical protein ABIA35_009730 [Catenulispora sp. MAP12-49]|uniref:hypothetical protein n=1 Tax=Catenulispora sp. MAP12-49 TaxID=3156302 RepID=UPI00351763CA